MLSNPTQFWQFTKNPDKLTKLDDYSEFILNDNSLFGLERIQAVGPDYIVQFPDFNVEYKFPATKTSLQIELHGFNISNTSIKTVRISQMRHFKVSATTPLYQINKISKAITSLEETFMYNANIRKISSTAFQHLPLLTTVKKVFYQCQNLERLPFQTFSGCSALQNAEMAFAESGISNGYPFDISNQSLTNLVKAFYGCANLTEAHLYFSHFAKVDMTACFKFCSKLRTYVSNSSNTVTSFREAFFSSGITDLANTPFDSTTHNMDNLIDATSMFEQSKLVRVANFMHNASKLRGTNRMFANCQQLTIVSNSFANLNLTNFTEMFYNCRKLTQTILFNGQDAWVKFPNATFTRMYRNCTSIPNFNSLPQNVK